MPENNTLGPVVSSGDNRLGPVVSSVQSRVAGMLEGSSTYIVGADKEDKYNWYGAPTGTEERKEFFSNLSPAWHDKVSTDFTRTNKYSPDEREALSAKHLGMPFSEAIAKQRGLVSERDLRYTTHEDLARRVEQQIRDKSPVLKESYAVQKSYDLMSIARDKGLAMTRTDGAWDVNYFTPIDNKTRAKLAFADTTKDKKERIQQVTGHPAKTDPGGRLLYYNKELKGYASVDALGLEYEDVFIDGIEEVLPIAATIGVAMALPEAGVVGGALLLSRLVAAGYEAATAVSIRGLQEGVEGLLSYSDGTPVDTQSQEEVVLDLVESFAADFLTTAAINTALPVFMERGNNILAGGAGVEERQLMDYVRKLSLDREARDPDEFGALVKSMDEFAMLEKTNPDKARHLMDNPSELLTEYNLRPSQINTSPLLARLEGMLAKLPGSGGVFSKLLKENEQLIRQEVAWWLRGTADADQLEGPLRKMLGDAYTARLKAKNKMYNVTGNDYVDPEDLGTRLFNWVERGKADFKNKSNARANNLDSLLDTQVGTNPNPKRQIIPVNSILKHYKSILDDPNVRGAIASNISGNPNLVSKLDSLMQRLQVSKETKGFKLQDDLSLKEVTTVEHTPAFLTHQEYRRIQSDFSELMVEVPFVKKKLAELSGKLRPTSIDTAAYSDMKIHMKSLGYDDATVNQYMKDFQSYNDWFAQQNQLYDLAADPNANYGQILKQFSSGGGSMETLSDFLLPMGGKAPTPNLKFARHLAENLDDDLLSAMQQHLTYRIMGDGSDRTPKQMLSLLSPDDPNLLSMLETIYGGKAGREAGEAQVVHLKTLAMELDKVRSSELFRLVAAPSQNKLLARSLVEKGNLHKYREAVELLKEQGNPAAAKEVRQLFLADLLESSEFLPKGEMFPTIDGKVLLNKIHDYGTKEVKEVLGKETFESIQALGNLARYDIDGGTAGGLAAGMFIVNILRSGDIVGGVATGIKLNIVAKLLTSKRVGDILSRPTLTTSSVEAKRKQAIALNYLIRNWESELAHQDQTRESGLARQSHIVQERLSTAEVDNNIRKFERLRRNKKWSTDIEPSTEKSASRKFLDKLKAL